MNPMSVKIILGISVVVWLLICLLLYEKSKSAAWLAGSTVASCLFFLGATVAASFLVKGSLFLAPLWAGVLALSLLHLRAAHRRLAYEGQHLARGRLPAGVTTPRPADKNESVYI